MSTLNTKLGEAVDHFFDNYGNIFMIGFLGCISLLLVAFLICVYVDESRPDFALKKDDWACTQYAVQHGAKGMPYRVCRQWTFKILVEAK